MYDFKINQIRAFVCVVKLGGFHHAAKALHKTQPAISLAVKSLERNLGQALFKKGNHANLTAFGEYFLKDATSLLEYHDEVRQLVGQDIIRRRHSVSIATLPSVAQHVMPPILKSFLQRFPDSQLNIRDTSSQRIQELIKERKIDFGICTIHDLGAGFTVEKIMEDRFGIVCNTSHAINQIKNPSWHDVSQFNPIKNGTWDILSPSQFALLDNASTITISNMSSLNAVLEAGIGVTVLPHLAYSEHNADLVFITLSAPTIYRQIGLVKLQDKDLPLAADRLFEHIRSDSD